MRGFDLYVANVEYSACVVSQRVTYFGSHLFLIPIKLFYFMSGKVIEMSFRRDWIWMYHQENGRHAGKTKLKIEWNCLGWYVSDVFYKSNTNLSDNKILTILPIVQKITIDPSIDDFMVLVCSGIWTRMSIQEVVNFVALKIRKEKSLLKICEEVVRKKIIYLYTSDVKIELWWTSAKRRIGF